MSGYLVLSALTTLPAGTVFPKDCGYLYLRADLKKKYEDMKNK
jgi:hypothetical protein